MKLLFVLETAQTHREALSCSLQPDAPQTCTLTGHTHKQHPQRFSQSGDTSRITDRGRGSLRPLPCPARSADPTVWTPAFRLRPCSRSDTAPSPGRSAGTVRTPGPSPRARAPPRTRSRDRDHDRDRARTSWSWGTLLSVTGGWKKWGWKPPLLRVFL